MPRKGKFIPADFGEREAIERNKKQQNALRITPLFAGLVSEEKFCFSGDVTLNMRWLKNQQLNYVEMYDVPFKGLISMEFKKDLRIVQLHYYSKVKQLNDNEGKVLQIVKQVASVSDTKTHEFARFLQDLTSQAEQQRIIGRALTQQKFKIDSLYSQAYKQAMGILALLNVEGAYFHYSIQHYNFELEQMEKSFNGMNLNSLKLGGMDTSKLSALRGRATSYMSDYLDIGHLVDPFNITDTIKEQFIHFPDGITLKALLHQRAFQLLPHCFYVLKVRLLYFDPQDLHKLRVFRDTGELLYPLQYTDFEMSGNDGYNDYAPKYNLDTFNKESVHPVCSQILINLANTISQPQQSSSSSLNDSEFVSKTIPNLYNTASTCCENNPSFSSSSQPSNQTIQIGIEEEPPQITQVQENRSARLAFPTESNKLDAITRRLIEDNEQQKQLFLNKFYPQK